MNLPMLDADKANHFIYGSVAATVSRAIGTYLLPQYGIPPAAAAMAGSCFAGVLKEGMDWYANRQAVARGEVAPHTVDPYDFVATAAGGVPVALAQL